MKQKEAVSAQLEWLDGALPGRVQMHTAGSQSVYIENYRRIAEFTSERICLSGAGGVYIIEGRGLCIEEMRSSALIIRGRILRIIFPEEVIP